MVNPPSLRLLWQWYCYGCPVFRSQKHVKPDQNIHGSQIFINLIFSISLGRFKKRFRTTGLDEICSQDFSKCITRSPTLMATKRFRNGYAYTNISVMT